MALLAFAGCGKGTTPGSAAVEKGAAKEKKKTIWTCSMHPQIRVDQPGRCPLCDMPLIPAEMGGDGEHGGPPHLQFGEHALAMASVETAPVERRTLEKELRAFGMIQFNEQGSPPEPAAWMDTSNGSSWITAASRSNT